MTEGYNRSNQKPMTALSEYLLYLTGDRIGENKRPPSLSLNVKRDGKQGPWCVSLTVKTNVEGDTTDYGRIEFLLSMPEMFCMLELINKWTMATESGNDRIEISSKRYIRSQNSMSKEPMLVGNITVGRTASGQIFIGVQSWEQNRPKCRFILRPVVDNRRSVKFYNRDGTPWEDGPLSQLYASGWVRQMGLLIADAYKNDYVAPPPRDNQETGGRQGGYNNRGGYRNDSSVQKSASDSSDGWSDDDIPM